MTSETSFRTREIPSGAFNLPPSRQQELSRKRSNIHNGSMPLRVSRELRQTRKGVDDVTERVFVEKKHPRSSTPPSQLADLKAKAPPPAPRLKALPRPVAPDSESSLPLDDDFSLSAPVSAEEEISWDLRQMTVEQNSGKTFVTITDIFFESQGSVGKKAKKE